MFFQIILHEKDKILLVQIKNYFAVGYIIKKKGNACEFRVSSIKELQILISHFDKYPLITQKLADYLLFKHAFNLIYCKKHLTKDGLDKFIAIKSSMNRGLSVVLSTIVVLPNAFETSPPQLQNSILPQPARNYSTLATPRPCSVKNLKVDPRFVTGFVDDEGCFHVFITENKNYKLEWRVKPLFLIELNKKDKSVLEGIKNFFGAGKISMTGPDAVQLRFESRKDLASVFYHFKKFSLITQKEADCKLWCDVIDIILRG